VLGQVGNAAFEARNGPAGIWVRTQPLVSADYVMDPRSAIVDGLHRWSGGSAQGLRLVRHEWAYSALAVGCMWRCWEGALTWAVPISASGPSLSRHISRSAVAVITRVIGLSRSMTGLRMLVVSLPAGYLFEIFLPVFVSYDFRLVTNSTGAWLRARFGLDYPWPGGGCRMWRGDAGADCSASWPLFSLGFVMAARDQADRKIHKMKAQAPSTRGAGTPWRDLGGAALFAGGDPHRLQECLKGVGFFSASVATRSLSAGGGMVAGLLLHLLALWCWAARWPA